MRSFDWTQTPDHTLNDVPGSYASYGGGGQLPSEASHTGTDLWGVIGGGPLPPPPGGFLCSCGYMASDLQNERAMIVYTANKHIFLY